MGFPLYSPANRAEEFGGELKCTKVWYVRFIDDSKQFGNFRNVKLQQFSAIDSSFQFFCLHSFVRRCG